MLLNLIFLVVLAHIFFRNKIIFKIPSKIDTDAMDDSMGINDNDQELVEINVTPMKLILIWV